MTITYHNDLPLCLVRKRLRYDPLSGDLTWRIAPKGHPRLHGAIAGCAASGYVKIKINGKAYAAHRLAWLLFYGKWPSRRIDHADGNSLNNAIANLRQATAGENCANAARRRGKRLPKGVRRLPSGNFQARIGAGKTIRTIGTYSTVDAAASAYLRSARAEFGEFARPA